MSERVVLCYGDSNTWGSKPVVGGRFPRDVRWPTVLASELGDDWRILVLGLPRLGRFEAGDAYDGVTEKADRLPDALRAEPGLAGVELLELHEIAAYADGDGFHLDEGGHLAVGRAVARRIAAMF